MKMGHKILRSHVDGGPAFAFAFRFVATGFVAFLGTETRLVSCGRSSRLVQGLMVYGISLKKRVGYFWIKSWLAKIG